MFELKRRQLGSQEGTYRSQWSPPDGQAGPGEGVPVRDRCGQPQVPAQGSHLVLVEVLERLHDPPQLTKLPHQLRVVVVGLDAVSMAA